MKTLKIGNASAFWGDDQTAAATLVKQQKDLDFLTLDYLAELSMSVMAVQKEKESQAGYAKDFIEVISSLLPAWKNGSKIKIVTNAGGLNPIGCAEACQKVIKESGLRLKIAVITGDDVLNHLQKVPSQKWFHNLDTDQSLTEVTQKLVTANAYIGAKPIAEALQGKAEIVIGGRIADPSLTVGPSLYHFGWQTEAFDKLAGATVAGHLIECGTQVTGGISNEWLQLPHLSEIGFPIAEVHADGSCVITKPRGTGGAVNERIVKQQLLYELGDPNCYLSPDATVSFLSLQLNDLGNDRVLIENAKGSAPTNFYKVSATYKVGYKAEAFLALFGKDVLKKAKKAAEILFEKLKRLGCAFQKTHIECLGANYLIPGTFPESELKECVLRIAVLDSNYHYLEQFSKSIASLVTSGPPGITGYTSGRAKIRPAFGFWPCLIPKDQVQLQVHYL